MSKGDIVVLVIVTIVIIALIGGFIGSIISENKAKENACATDAKALGLEYRYDSGCQLQTPGGVWLSEHDYLLLYATENR